MCGESIGTGVVYGVSDGSFHGCVLFRLAADVREGEEQMVVLVEHGWQTKLHFVVE